MKFSTAKFGESTYKDLGGKQIVITPDKFDVFQRALGHLVDDLVNKPRTNKNKGGK